MWPVLLMLALGAPSAEVQAAHAELDAVAARIELLKARHAVGDDVARELHRLLVRAQELSHVIERGSARARPARPLVLAPSPEELRERADAGRDEADRLASVMEGLDERIAALRRAEAGARPPARARPDEATFASAVAPSRAVAEPSPRLRALVAHRAMLAERLVAVQAEIDRLEAEARRLEEAP
jgi:hypothetical protein